MARRFQPRVDVQPRGGRNIPVASRPRVFNRRGRDESRDASSGSESGSEVETRISLQSKKKNGSKREDLLEEVIARLRIIETSNQHMITKMDNITDAILEPVEEQEDDSRRRSSKKITTPQKGSKWAPMTAR